ncbi:hypothetical protein Sjap_016148 [Stephania japonica]|uniref:Uncharacterized protein n=1 Tax=Stephania japonica TaxID=461633 RepID=A0AAP0IKG7_9MAGN
MEGLCERVTEGFTKFRFGRLDEKGRGVGVPGFHGGVDGGGFGESGVNGVGVLRCFLEYFSYMNLGEHKRTSSSPKTASSIWVFQLYVVWLCGTCGDVVWPSGLVCL